MIVQNPATTIEFALPVCADVGVDIYNLIGQKIATLVSGARLCLPLETERTLNESTLMNLWYVSNR